MKKIVISLALAFCLSTNAQIITTVCGNGTQGFSGDGGQASVAELNIPSSVIIDVWGDLYVSDWGNNRIRKINTNGVITTIAGTGAGSYSGDGGQATNAEIQGPQNIVFDAVGNLFILDAWNNRVRKVSTAGIITTVAGNGSSITSGDGGQATAAGIYRPTSLVFDALGNMIIAECYGNKIRKVNTAGIISTIAGNGTGAFSGDGGPATAAELNQPICLLFDASGNLYITDYHNNRIRKINTAGIITTIAGNGTGAFSGDGGPATAASINNPVNFEIDISGNIYFSDYLNNRVRKINTAGIITTVAGNGTAGYSGDGGQATASELNQPLGLVFDTYGNLFIADFQNSRIRKVTNVGQATGIEQIKENNVQANIYPNPTNGNFTIETTDKQSMQVFDITGKLVLSQVINGKTNIDASTLNEGVYTLNISGSEGAINKKLVIVK